jgi:hypothetical protein
MEHISQGEDIYMCPSSIHLLALSEDRNVRVEVLDQGMTIYQSTEDMRETISPLHYSALTGMIEDDMWIIDNGASRHMTGDQARISNLNEKKTLYKVELGDKSTYPVEGFGQCSLKQSFICTWFRKESCIHILPRRKGKHNRFFGWKSFIMA